MPNLFLILGTLQLSANAQQESLPQCQCIPPRTGTHECQQYDSRYQAATLEEAMASFPDLSLNQDDTGHLTTLQSEATCQTQECLDCQKDLRKKLERKETLLGTKIIYLRRTVVQMFYEPIIFMIDLVQCTIKTRLETKNT
ncbi:hypothetical protein NECAME_12937 [Necator americanus]|uniref:Uncharacterized protein n=1 Tax=Necator americanus TaxID=51031 RepID=W2T0J2_NECAM|nr:hypothetical protein NECAME_12937 [Necator americanus]ETN74492.1 hypothetical protein NECAME_12937 [Necator americanus]